MTDDYRFVDCGGRAWHGRTDCLAAWSGFFAAFPDPQRFAALSIRGAVVIATGRAAVSVGDRPPPGSPAR